MPPMSSAREKPPVTPVTMFATSARIRPCMARARFSSLSRETTTSPSWMAIAQCGASASSSVPFGPFTRTRPSATCTSTPLASFTGCLPMRDISPDLREQLAADAGVARLGVGQDAARRGQNGDAQAAADLRDLLRAHVHAPAGARDALHALDDRAVVGAVADLDGERRLGGLGVVAEAGDEAVRVQHAR